MTISRESSNEQNLLSREEASDLGRGFMDRAKAALKQNSGFAAAIAKKYIDELDDRFQKAPTFEKDDVEYMVYRDHTGVLKKLGIIRTPKHGDSENYIMAARQDYGTNNYTYQFTIRKGDTPGAWEQNTIGAAEKFESLLQELES